MIKRWRFNKQNSSREGTVDIDKVGTYKLVYSVTDSKNETTTP